MSTPRLAEKYQKEVVPILKKEFGIENRMAVPKVEKVVLNMGIGEAITNAKLVDAAAEELTKIAGQRAVVTKAKKSIATFKLRAGMPIGCRVTLRGDRMYEFLDRLMNVALPRVRDFPRSTRRTSFPSSRRNSASKIRWRCRRWRRSSSTWALARRSRTPSSWTPRRKS
jgi:large subunit ribosomal protein L5